MNEKENSLRTIFIEAVEITDGAERVAYLQRACGDDAPLRQRIDKLLKSHAEAGGFTHSEGETNVILPVTEKPGDCIDRYKLREQIGEGGCGVVYVAEQEEPVRRRVALKVLKLGMDTRSVVARFEAERQALAMMDHPNIAKVLDAGATATGRPYFVMELVRGIKITDYCDQNKLSTQQRLDLFIQVCHAIQHAHQKGIIHRDIKPSNVLVTLHDSVPVPKVIDFGIAKATEGRLTDLTIYTELHQFIGTPAYMSPEQAGRSGLDIDTRSDIYSLGVLLYELLAGTTPFDATELMVSGLDAMRKTIREKEPVRPSTKLSQTLQRADVRRLKDPSSNTPGSDEEVRTSARRLLRTKETIHQLKGDLDWIVMKCLEKDRTRRYETANGLAADLKRHLNNEPVVARPARVAYRFQKSFRRNKMVFSAATAVVAALVVGVGVSTWQAVEARIAQRATEAARNGEQQQRLEAQAAQKAADAQAQKASKSEQQSRRLLYASDMNLAQQSLKLNNLGRARRLLERHRPQSGEEEDLRGWEWRYLWQLTRSRALVTLTNRPVRGLSVSFSPDGTRLAVVPEIGSSTEVLGWFGTNILCQWNGADQILVRELRGMEFIPRGVIALDSSTRPMGCAYNATRQLLAWTEEASSNSVYVASLGAIRPRIELKGDLRGLVPLRFSEDGNYLVAYKIGVDSLRAWNIETRKIVTSINEAVKGSAFAAGGQVLVAAIKQGNTHEICFYDLDQPAQAPRRFPGREESYHLAVSPDGGVVAASTTGGQVRLFDPRKGELTEPVHGHLNAAFGLAFSADGRRLISAGTGQEAVKLWDVGTRQELLTLGGTGSILHEARWSADENVILAGAPWQAWRAPSWEEIAAAEAKEKESAKSQ